MDGHQCEGNVCMHCGQKYSDILSLNRHTKEKHTGGANRVCCEICKKWFAASSDPRNY